MATYRHSGHYVGDAEQYRAREEVDASRQFGDPITRFVQTIVDGGLLTQVDVDAVTAGVEAQIDTAQAFASAAPYPDAAEALRDVFTVGGQQ